MANDGCRRLASFPLSGGRREGRKMLAPLRLRVSLLLLLLPALLLADPTHLKLDEKCTNCKVAFSPLTQKYVMQPGESVYINVSVTVEGGTKSMLDFFLLQDASGSYSDDANTLSAISGAIAAELKTLSPDLRVGISTYSDRGDASNSVEVSGVKSATGGWFTDYQVPMTNDVAKFEKKLKDKLEIFGGGDLPEAQLDGM